MTSFIKTKKQILPLTIFFSLFLTTHCSLKKTQSTTETQIISINRSSFEHNFIKLLIEKSVFEKKSNKITSTFNVKNKKIALSIKDNKETLSLEKWLDSSSPEKKVMSVFAEVTPLSSEQKSALFWHLSVHPPQRIKLTPYVGPNFSKNFLPKESPRFICHTKEKLIEDYCRYLNSWISTNLALLQITNSQLFPLEIKFSSSPITKEKFVLSYLALPIMIHEKLFFHSLSDLEDEAIWKKILSLSSKELH